VGELGETLARTAEATAMLYLVALLLPALALVWCGRPWQAAAALGLHLTVVGWLPAALWALVVVDRNERDRRAAARIRAAWRDDAR
jgi:uncharacterized membrane protein YqaE (UPF0057 family)